MFGKASLTKVSLKKAGIALVCVSAVALLAGCSTSDSSDLPNPIGPSKGFRAVNNPMSLRRPDASAEGVTPVVQAYCPQVVMREESAVHRAFVGKATDDQSKLIYQASLADATRSCSANETTLTINVLAQGRIVAGPAGKTGALTLPMLVEVVDGDTVIYSQKVPFSVTIPPEGSGQFIFQKPDVSIPNAQGGASRFTTVRIGFDTGAAAPRKGSKRG